jgi:hypothetical protein
MHVLINRRIAFGSIVVGLLGAITFGISLRTSSQQLKPTTPDAAADNLSQQIEKSADQPLRVLENDDAPLRVIEAKVKEISGSEFTKLTGKKTDLLAVCSVPEVRLLNSSGKTITQFVLAVRNPASKTTRGIVHSQLSLAPGSTFTVGRQFFVRQEWTSTLEPGGQVKVSRERPEISSERYWISFAERSQLFVTVGEVEFQDGTRWRVKEGGDIR